MLRYTTGDMFLSGAMALVNTVNTEGFMGKGLALQFKKRFPENFSAYAAACKKREVRLGSMFVTRLNTLDDSQYIINFPTKEKWRNKSRMSDIISGLQDLKKVLHELRITSVAVPPLGCGLGGLRWQDVRTEIENTFSDADIEIIVYEPLQGANPALQPANPPKLTQARALFLRCCQHYMNMVPSIDITFLEAHKLAYFLQSIGNADLRLRFAAWRYGPYAVNLSHVLADMEGVWIVGFGDGTRKAFETFRLLPAAREAETLPLSEDYERALQRTGAVCAGFEAPLDMEVLASVHWLLKQKGVPPRAEDIRQALASWENNKEGWGDRKAKLFPPKLVDLALARLQSVEQ